jgi:hypothetical protein
MSDPKDKVKKSELKKAINAMCKHCIYDETSVGTWRKQVEGCTAPQCPLFAYRANSSYKGDGLTPPPRSIT